MPVVWGRFNAGFVFLLKARQGVSELMELRHLVEDSMVIWLGSGLCLMLVICTVVV